MASDKMPVFANVSPDPAKRGLPLSDRVIKRLIQDISEVAKVKFSCHWLRHSHARRFDCLLQRIGIHPTDA
ncbi:MAG: hypothetical protein V7K50_07805 [Nostoc sp.]|uniref:hypothetical protein n=1 Tax=Nostoc sp. TaxID=1180 RepID=UPI002FFC4B3D